ncbi:Cortical protein marker for cell polarity [Phycisphaerae bacterium RAS1]|nr:Cortical protein marker for cell polarity [Phycisphaerae bacterium RAS1]
MEANYIAKWNGDGWSPLGSGMNFPVNCLTVFDDGSGPALYAGGSFTSAGGVPASRIAKWNGASWSPLGSGMSSTVYALTVFDDGSGPALFAGGGFTTAGDVESSRIAKWNGSSWSPLGAGVSDGTTVTAVYALTVFDDDSGPALYAGGDFSSAGGVTASRIAKWDGNSWCPLGGGVNDSVRAMTVFDDGSGPALYVGGDFTNAANGKVAASRIAKCDGIRWSPLDIGMSNGWVSALTVFDDGSGPALYAGGFFTTAGGVPANSIAKWNGSSWSALGIGMNNTVFDLTVFDDGVGAALFAGGLFTTAGGEAASRIGKWSGSNWSPLGSGISAGPFVSMVLAVTVFGDGSGPALYAGGNFSTAGGVLSSGIAVWGGCPRVLGDLNCDGAADVLDINPFVLALIDPVGYAAMFPDCNILNGDIDGDGHTTVLDINPFVDLLLSGC